MLSPYRTKRWVFALGDVTHKVEAWLQVGRYVRLTVDGEVLEWPQSWLDVLDFGGKFDFELWSPAAGRRAATAHQCLLVINTIRMYLFVDGVDIETGARTSAVSVGRWVIRCIVFVLVAAAFVLYRMAR
jgi:hypothetical protein